MATNCPDMILAASFAVIGGRADDSTMALLGWLVLLLGLEPAIAITSTGRVANDSERLAAGLALALL